MPLRNRLLGRNELLGKLGSLAPQLANLALHNPISRFLAEKTMGIASQAPLPTWSTTGTLSDWLRRTQRQRLKAQKKVVYFHGCATMYYEPFVGKAAIAVLEHQGYEVIVPPQNCCGLPLLSNGEFKAAVGYHQGNVARLAGFARGPAHCRHQHELHANLERRGARIARHERRQHPATQAGHLGYF